MAPKVSKLEPKDAKIVILVAKMRPTVPKLVWIPPPRAPAAADKAKMGPKIRAVTAPSDTARILCPSGLVFLSSWLPFRAPAAADRAKMGPV